MSKFYSINTPGVVHENVDGEVIVIDLEKGTYYSLVKVAGDIWGGIENSCCHQTIVNQVLQKYEGDVVEITQTVTEFIKQLQEEELITATSTEDADVEVTIEEIPEKLTFEAPTLNKCTDMQELLLINPVY